MKKVILVADDSASIRKFVALALSAKGFEIIQVSDGMEALEMLPRENVDLIITDLNMPNIDGFELIKSIRKNPMYEDIPIIILSSLVNNEIIDKGLEYGANSYLTKPFDKNLILYEVSKYLN